VNFVITALAFLSIIVLFFSVQPWSQGPSSSNWAKW